MTTKKQHDPDFPKLAYHDGQAADFIFFDGAPAFAGFNGLIAITLTAMRYIPGPDKVAVDSVVVGHLRTNIQGAIALRNAIDDALLLAVPPDGQKN